MSAPGAASRSKTSWRPSSLDVSTSIGALALVEAGPVEAVALGVEGEAAGVGGAADGVEADDLGAQLRQRHGARRPGHVGGDLDEAETLQRLGPGGAAGASEVWTCSVVMEPPSIVPADAARPGRAVCDRLVDRPRRTDGSRCERASAPGELR